MKIIHICLVLIYFFTAQLTVHAFAMHPASHGDHHHDTSDSDCGHPQPSHNHETDHGEDDHEDHEMSLCLEQSIGLLSSDVFDIPTPQLAIVPPTWKQYRDIEQVIDQYFYSLNDPGWGSDGVFSKFLKHDLYGHGIIMHC